MSALLEVQGLSKRFGAVVACDQVDLEVHAGEVHAVIGPNGAGKTTLVAQLSGELRPDAGRIVFVHRDLTDLPAHRRAHLGLARSFQIASLFDQLTVLDNVALAVQAMAGHSYRFWADARAVPELREPAMAALRRVGLDARADLLVGEVAHGEKRQLELAMALASAPSLLLLDEPLAGLGAEETAAMIARLREIRKDHAMLLVEHDMDAVFALADRISVMVQGRVIASGPPAAIRADAEVRAAYLGEDEHAPA